MDRVFDPRFGKGSLNTGEQIQRAISQHQLFHKNANTTENTFHHISHLVVHSLYLFRALDIRWNKNHPVSIGSCFNVRLKLDLAEILTRTTANWKPMNTLRNSIHAVISVPEKLVSDSALKIQLNDSFR